VPNIYVTDTRQIALSGPLKLSVVVTFTYTNCITVGVISGNETWSTVHTSSNFQRKSVCCCIELLHNYLSALSCPCHIHAFAVCAVFSVVFVGKSARLEADRVWSVCLTVGGRYRRRQVSFWPHVKLVDSRVLLMLTTLGLWTHAASIVTSAINNIMHHVVIVCFEVNIFCARRLRFSSAVSAVQQRGI